MKKPLKQELRRSQAMIKYTLEIKDIKLLTLSRYKAVIFSVETNYQTHLHQTKIFSQFSALNWKIEVSSVSPLLTFYECIKGQKGEKIGEVILSNDASKVLTIYTGFPTIKVCSFSFSITSSSSYHSLTTPLPNIFSISEEESVERNTSEQRDDSKQTSQSRISSAQSRAYWSERQDQEVSVSKKAKKSSKVLNQSLKFSEDEKQVFSQYQDDSTLSIQQLGSETEDQVSLKAHHQKQISHNHQNTEYQNLNGNQRWGKHINKRNIANKKQMSRIRRELKRSSGFQKGYNVVYHSQNFPSQNIKQYKNFSQISITCKFKITEIVMFQRQTQIGAGNENAKEKILVRVFRNCESPSDSWNITFMIPHYEILFVRCIAEGKMFVGKIGRIEERSGQTQLYEQGSSTRIVFNFKIKNVCTNAVQTQDILPFQEGETIQKIDKSTIPQLKRYLERIYEQQQESLIHCSSGKRVKSYDIRRMEPSGSAVPNSSLQSFVHEPLLSIKSSQQKIENHFDINEFCFDEEFGKIGLQQLGANCNKSGQTEKCLHSKREDLANNQQTSFDKKRKSQSILELKPNDETDLTHETSICNDLLHAPQTSFNIKISSIVVKLVHKSILSKLLKLQLHGTSIPYYTDPIKSLELLDWRDKGYYFLKASEWSILNIEMLEEKNETLSVVGKCKVYLTNLIDNNKKGVCQHTNFFKNSSQEIIGHTIIEYQFFQRNSRGLNSLSSLQCLDKSKQIQYASQFQRNLSSLSKDQSKRKSSNVILQSNKNKISTANSSRNDQYINASKRQKRNFSMVERKQVCQQSSPHMYRNRKGAAQKVFISKEKRFRTMKNELFYHPSFSEVRIRNQHQNEKAII